MTRMTRRKESILEAAAVLFAQKGFKETSMSEVSKISGVAQGTIFYHFKSKEGLLLAILEDLKSKVLESFEDFYRNENFSCGLEMVEGVIAFYLDLASRLEDRFLVLHRHISYELALENPGCRQCMEAIYDCFVDIFEQAIRQGQLDGSIIALPAKKAALILYTMVDGLVRLDTYQLYEAASLYEELLELCRRMLATTA